MTRPFALVDVFADSPFTGNPLAVVTGTHGLDTEAMLRITQWLNLSETTFLMPPTSPDADYAVRIFTLEREMPFAGHPTLGTAHVWRENGGKTKTTGRIVQECGIGLVTIKEQGELRAFGAPMRLRTGPLDDPKIDEICAILQIERSAIVDHQWLDNGPGWAGIMLKSAADVRAVKPLGNWPQRADIGLVGPEAAGAATQWEVRAIFSNHHGALVEDPVTGSLNASVAQWLYETGRASDPYVAAQGSSVGRAGRVYVNRDPDGTIWVGGRSQTLFRGSMNPT